MAIPFDLASGLEAALRSAASKLDAFDSDFEPDLRPADPRFGDCQANGVLPFAKSRKTNPRALAQKLVEACVEPGVLPMAGIEVSVAGPGFINFTFGPEVLTDWLKARGESVDLHAAANPLLQGRKVVVDYPSPNTAKQMHIGHLRPMVIGEAIQRLLRFCGADIIRDNHLGDWGTNFGTLIMALKREGLSLDENDSPQLDSLEALYKKGVALEKEHPELRGQSRAELLKLQQGDAENTRIWERIVAISNAAFTEIYRMLELESDVTLGESFYRDKVERIYRELTEAGIAEESEGALVVFHPEHPRFATQPFIIRKQDGASNYASTDLATLLYRVEHFAADEIIYVTDGRQKDHFEQLFLTAEKWFAATGRTLPELRHVWFGTILGEDGKAIKTRSGDPIRLKQLLEEGVDRAYHIVSEKNPELADEVRRDIAHAVGLGAIRYADLSQNRTQDYVFSWPKLLSFDGNTAPYLLYAVARIHSIFRKAGLRPDNESLAQEADCLTEESEIALARKLVAFPTVLNQTLAELRPHFLCTYLYELAGQFSAFYNAEKVIDEDATIRSRRLLLCAVTLQILENGLRTLGLRTLERM